MFRIKTMAAAAMIMAGLIAGAACTANAAPRKSTTSDDAVLFRNGTMKHVRRGSKADKMIMRHVKEYTGDMMYMSRGHLYSIENAPMPGGHMLYEMLSPGNPNYEPDLYH